MIKSKVGLFACILFIGILILSFVSGVDAEGFQDNLDQLQNTKDNIEKTKEQIENEKYEYLGTQWKTFLLKNKYFGYFDAGMRKTNFLSVIILGQNYDFNFTFFMVLFLWIFFFFSYSSIFRNFSTFSPGISSLIALGITIITAQLGVLRKISDVIFKIIFYKSGAWPWIAFFISIIVLFFLFALIRIAGKYGKQWRKKKSDGEVELNKKVINKYGEGLRGV